MHGSFETSGETSNINYGRWGIGLFAVPVLIVMALIGLAITQPDTSNWISEAVQAEFAATTLVPDVAPTRLAKPAMEIRTVRAE